VTATITHIGGQNNKLVDCTETEFSFRLKHMPCLCLTGWPTLSISVCYNKGVSMRTVSIFRNGKNQAVRLPKDMEFEGVTELEIIREGDAVILRPARPDWLSFAELPAEDADFLEKRPVVVDDEGRFTL